MAYLAFDDGAAATSPGPFAATAAPPVPATAVATRFSALEWSVIALARRDRLSSLRRPGRIAIALRTVFGHANPALADERLEALRRMAVWSWHHGYAVPTGEVRAFVGAGFSLGQYETLLAGIAATRRREGGRR